MFTLAGKCGTPSRAVPSKSVVAPASRSRSTPRRSTYGMSFHAAGGLVTAISTSSTPATQAAFSASRPPIPPDGT